MDILQCGVSQLVYSCRDRVDVGVTIIIIGNGQSGPSLEVFLYGRQLWILSSWLSIH